MRITLALLLLGGALLLLGLIHLRVQIRRSRSTTVPYVLTALGIALLIAAGGHELLAHAISATPVRINHLTRYRPVTYQQLQHHTLKQIPVIINGRIIKLAHVHDTAPTYLLVATAGAADGVIVVNVTNHTIVNQNLTCGNHVAVRGISRGTCHRAVYRNLPAVSALQISMTIGRPHT